MQCYTELTPPTAVTHSISLPLVSAHSNNLVVAKSSVLQIFRTKVISAELDSSQYSSNQTIQPSKQSNQYDVRINDDDGLESSFLGGDTSFLRSDRANNTKLVLVAEIGLSGTVTGLARVRTAKSKSGGEALLIAFKDAKLSLNEWDPERFALSTISVHYYEQDELQGSPWDAPLSEHVNILASDCGNRCAALKFGPRSLAILPFERQDEDMEMDDWDEELDGPRPVNGHASTQVNGTSSLDETPYSASFVLRLPNLDESLLFPVHLAFLYEYKEPTFGILSSTIAPSASLGRKDHLSYTVFTLDLQQKASTTILSVGGLPADLFRVIALPAPVGGALLVGANELIHIDQSGKPNGIAVNPMTKQATSFSLLDHSELKMRLEGCVIEILSAENGELLVILNDGRLALLTFSVDGRTVSGLHLKLVPLEKGGALLPSAATCLTKVGRNSMLVGSDESDSFVLGWTRKINQAARKKSRVLDQSPDFEADEDEDMGDDEGDDDLYGDNNPTQSHAMTNTIKAGELSFRIQDRLISLAPVRDMTYGKEGVAADSEEEQNHRGLRGELQLVCAVGRQQAGSLAILEREMQPKVVGRFEFPEARGLWTMSAQKPIPKALQGDKGEGAVGGDYDRSAQYDRFMIVSKVDLDGYETSDVYALTSAGFEALTGTEFEPAAGFTIEAGTMGNHMRIIQVLKSEVRVYDGDLGLSQIHPMLDEETGAEPRVVSASIADPFLLLVRDDTSVSVVQINRDNELEELEKEDSALLSNKWLSGCLYADANGMFAALQTDKGTKSGENIYMFLQNSTGALFIYALPDLTKPVYVAEGLCFVPPLLTADFTARRGMARETIVELLVADLGDATHKSPHLILRHANDDLTIYEPIRIDGADKDAGLRKTLSFSKLPNAAFAKPPNIAAQDDADNEPRMKPLRPCDNINGYSTVFMPGASPGFIVKSSKATARVIGLRGPGVRAISPFHTEGCYRGFIYADSSGTARVSQLDVDTSYAELGVAVKKVPLNSDIHCITYHPPTQSYVAACLIEEPFELPRDDDYHKEWARENLPFKPIVEKGVVKLISPISWMIIDAVEMEDYEIILSMKTLNLEVSEETHERKQLIVVGTGISRGEDLPIRGRIHVYDVVSVIPEPGKPETNKKLKLITKEDIPRGAVTTISEIGSQGLMIIAQGQKCMVRGLKEDNTLLPVAFMDMSCYVTSIKEVPGTGLCLMSDAFKGVWFTGYTEEPYKMILFGKSLTTMEVLNADFLPDGRELFIMAMDGDGNIHVLQFDPEHPKTLQGQLLLHKTSFCTGAHSPTLSKLLPRTDPNPASLLHQSGYANGGEDSQRHILLMASPTGMLSALSPLSENSYRRLSGLAAQLGTSLPHAGGLNPKAYRMTSLGTASTTRGGGQPPGVDAAVGRNIVDGALLTRWGELSSGRRAEIAGRVGFSSPEEVRAELEAVLGWGGMAYF